MTQHFSENCTIQEKSRPAPTGIISGDLRQNYLAQWLADKSFPYLWIDAPDKETISSCSSIIAPTPFTRDQKTILGHPTLTISQFLSFLVPGQRLFGGSLPQQVMDFCQTRKIACCDLLRVKGVSEKNAAATAEGAVCEAITASPINLEGSPCLLAGYGCCGQAIARKLTGLGADVYLLEIDKEKQNQAKKEGFSCIQNHTLASFLENTPILFLFNTVPCPIFGEELLEKTSSSITIIDIASAPGGVDFEYCRQSGRTALLCPGLPGRYAPKTSAEILGSAFLSTLPCNPKSLEVF